MNLQFVIFFTIFLAVYSLLNFYVGLRTIQILHHLIPSLNKIVYWLFFWLLAQSYVLGRLLKEPLLSNSLTYVGAYWLGAFYYLLLTFFLRDVIGFLGKWTGIITNYEKYRSLSGIAVIMIVCITMIYGVWNARTPQVTHYEFSIPKKAGTLKQLHVVAVSDIHLGNLVNKNRLKELIKKIKELNPDVVLLAGDVIDEDIKPFVEGNMKDTFLELKPKYGIYAVLGNHEYIGEHVEAAIHYLDEAGIKILRDDKVIINESFYIVGRDDKSRNRFMKTPRKDLAELLRGINKSLPIILLDHQPYELEKVAQEGVDVQISGHTHNGQLFPNNLITAKIFEIDWGHLKKGNLNVIVSSGFGTWGPPIKVGSPSEIIDLNISFK